MLEALDAAEARLVVACAADWPRAMPAAEVAAPPRRSASRPRSRRTSPTPSPGSGTAAGTDDLVLVTGSLYVVGEARRALGVGRRLTAPPAPPAPIRPCRRGARSVSASWIAPSSSASPTPSSAASSARSSAASSARASGSSPPSCGAIDEATAGRHYAEHEGKPFYDDLVAFITRGPALLLVVEGPEDTWQVVRTMMGATNPREAAPGTIRGDLGTAVHREPGARLATRRSRPTREIGIFFPDLLTATAVTTASRRRSWPRRAALVGSGHPCPALRRGGLPACPTACSAISWAATWPSTSARPTPSSTCAGAGIVLNEPSVVAVNVKDGRPLAVGARGQADDRPHAGHIQAIRPLKDGVIADFEICEKMLRYFIHKVHQRRWVKPRMVICVPSGITGVEQRAVQEAAEYAGARKPAYIIEEPMAAAIGAGLPVQEPTGNMIVDIGGGTTEVAVISLGGIVASQSVRVGGDELDEAIIQFIKKEYSLALGERTAEEVKIALGSAWPLEEELTAEIRGRDLVTGLPKTIVTSTEEIREAHRGAGRRHRRRGEGHRSTRRRPSWRPTSWSRASCSPAVARCCSASRAPRRPRPACRSCIAAEPAARGGHRLGPVPRGVRGPEGRALLVHSH